MQIDDLFPDRITKTATCWLWSRPAKNGYGTAYYDGRTWTAHRLALVLALGREDFDVARHRCDVPRCVRPDHLEPGTVADNIHDMHDRGRAAKGGGPVIPLAGISPDLCKRVAGLFS